MMWWTQSVDYGVLFEASKSPISSTTEASSETNSDNDDEDTSSSLSDWYLERIVVVGPDGESWSFPFSNWVGRASSSMTGTFGQSLGKQKDGRLFDIFPHGLRIVWSVMRFTYDFLNPPQVRPNTRWFLRACTCPPYETHGITISSSLSR